MSAFVPSFAPFGCAAARAPTNRHHINNNNNNNNNIFSASSSTIITPQCRRFPTNSVNRSCITPFFASSAFGVNPIITPTPTTRTTTTTTTTSQPQPSRTTPAMEVTVVVGDNEPVESALRRFKKDVAKSGHLFELKRRRYFETNTEKRIRKAAASKRKAKLARAISKRGNK